MICVRLAFQATMRRSFGNLSCGAIVFRTLQKKVSSLIEPVRNCQFFEIARWRKCSSRLHFLSPLLLLVSLLWGWTQDNDKIKYDDIYYYSYSYCIIVSSCIHCCPFFITTRILDCTALVAICLLRRCLYVIKKILSLFFSSSIMHRASCLLCTAVIIAWTEFGKLITGECYFPLWWSLWLLPQKAQTSHLVVSFFCDYTLY